MKELVDRIRQDGVHVGGGIVKVDSFLNHQVDPALMERMAKELHRQFITVGVQNVTRVVTAEASGIAIALTTAVQYNAKLIFARKGQSRVMTGTYYVSESVSRTRGTTSELMIDRRFLGVEDHALIVDDSLALSLGHSASNTGELCFWSSIDDFLNEFCSHYGGDGVIDRCRGAGKYQWVEGHRTREALKISDVVSSQTDLVIDFTCSQGSGGGLSQQNVLRDHRKRSINKIRNNRNTSDEHQVVDRRFPDTVGEGDGLLVARNQPVGGIENQGPQQRRLRSREGLVKGGLAVDDRQQRRLPFLLISGGLEKLDRDRRQDT